MADGSGSNLEVHIPKPEDLPHIFAAIARYHRGLDKADRDEFLNGFTDEGTILSPMVGDGVFRGRSGNLGEFFDIFWSEGYKPYQGGQHWFNGSNAIFNSVAQDRVELWYPVLFVMPQPDGAKYVDADLMYGESTDIVVRARGTWLIETKTLGMSTQTPELLARS